MRIISKSTLVHFWQKHSDSEPHLSQWYRDVKNANWKTPQDVKSQYPKASIIGDNRVVFDINGGSYRLVAKIDYRYRKAVYIRFVGTHNEYDKINAEEV